jgi:hypothetical protein
LNGVGAESSQTRIHRPGAVQNKKDEKEYKKDSLFVLEGVEES